MKILMILGLPFPPDNRVKKEALSLIKAGHKVYLFCRHLQGQLFEEVLDGICIKRIPYKRNLLLVRLQILYTEASMFYPEFFSAVDAFLRLEKVDAIHVHDLPLVKTGIYLARKYGIPLVADLHENFPDSVACWRQLRPVWKRIFYSPPRRWRRHEREILPQCDHIIAVVEESKDRIVRECCVDPGKITVIPNLVDAQSYPSAEIDCNLATQCKDRFVLIYAGTLGPHRGLDVAVKAMTFVKTKIPQALLILAGGKGCEPELKQLVNKLNLNDSVFITGWQPAEKLYGYICLAQVCLIPNHRNPQTDASSPNKLFEYMFNRKPVIVSNCTSLERIVRETGAGLVFEAGNPYDLADKIVVIHNNSSNYGESGYRAVVTKYNWNRASRNLIELYSELDNARS